MTTVHDACKKRLLEVFDDCQAAFDHMINARKIAKDANAAENKAECAYLNAKSEWEKALKAAGPGDTSSEKRRQGEER